MHAMQVLSRLSYIPTLFGPPGAVLTIAARPRPEQGWPRVLEHIPNIGILGKPLLQKRFPRSFVHNCLVDSWLTRDLEL